MVKSVAIVTGGSRGIGRGITKALADSGLFGGILITFNTNADAAATYAAELSAAHADLQVRTVGGDLSAAATRDALFAAYDGAFDAAGGWGLACVVHNAGQYVGVTSENADGLDQGVFKFGEGSLLGADGAGKPDLRHMAYYQKLYGEAFVDLCERSVVRMKAAREACLQKGVAYHGSLVGISSPGCNAAFRVTAGYDMPGSGKCIMEFASRQYAINVASAGITSNVIVPGITRSDAWSAVAKTRGVSGEAFLKRMKKNVPLGELAEGTDIGDLVVFLSRPGGGRFMTGLSLRCDGGLHLK